MDHQPLQEVLAAWLQIQNLPALQASSNRKLQIKLEAVAAALEDGYEVVLDYGNDSYKILIQDWVCTKTRDSARSSNHSSKNGYEFS